jgi:hypothetical protein
VTDRDHFAAAALTGLLANPKNNDSTADTIRFWAWNWADAMLREREQTGSRPTIDGIPVPPDPTNHDAAPAARAPTDASPLRPDQGVTVGMGTGDTQGPLAWWVTLPGRDFPYLSHIQERAIFCQNDEPGSEVVPLYRQPQPTLTDEEREAIADAASRYVEGITPKAQEYAATLRGLLERTK